MRLARIAHPDGVAFVSVDGAGRGADRAGRSRTTRSAPRPSPGDRWPLADTRLLAPILPSKVVAIGRNYADHAAELGNAVPTSPMIFLKPSTSVIGPRRADPAAGVVAAGRLRGRTRRGDRPAVPGRAGPRTPSSVILGLHGRQRRDRPRPAEGRRAVHPGQGLRHVLPARPVDRDRARPVGSRACAPSSTARSCRTADTSDMVFTVGEIVEFVSGDHDPAAR